MQRIWSRAENPRAKESAINRNLFEMFTNAYSGGPYSGASEYSGYSALAKPRAAINISYDTSSKDPHMMRCRLFVGGISTNVSRDDVIALFMPYGNILGLTLFKGYAFVQYSSVAEADLAVSALHQYFWHGSGLEVKIASKSQPDNKGTSNGTSIKRQLVDSSQPSFFGGNDAKKGRPQNSTAFATAYIQSATENKREINDLLVCGMCRYTTSCLESFVSHRKTQCNEQSGRKFEGEPESIECCSCEENFPTSWELIDHLSKLHNLAVFRQPQQDKKEVK